MRFVVTMLRYQIGCGELRSNVRCAFWYVTNHFMKYDDLLIKFFDSGYGVWHCIKAICYASTYDCISHAYFFVS